jgi:hypothetical protein
MAAGDSVEVMENLIVRRLAVSSIAWLGLSRCCCVIMRLGEFANAKRHAQVTEPAAKKCSENDNVPTRKTTRSGFHSAAVGSQCVLAVAASWLRSRTARPISAKAIANNKTPLHGNGGFAEGGIRPNEKKISRGGRESAPQQNEVNKP